MKMTKIALLIAGIFIICSCSLERQEPESKVLPLEGLDANKGFMPAGTNFFAYCLEDVDEDDVNLKIDEMKEHFFFNEDTRIYVPSGNNMAYIHAVDSDDVRSEGMSYGMMIAVQLGLQDEFNKLWLWAKTHMRYNTPGDPREGYFAWRRHTDGSAFTRTMTVPGFRWTYEITDPHAVNPAPDGEEYFAMSLFLAHERWGDEQYKTDAEDILDHMINNPQVTVEEWTVYDSDGDGSVYDETPEFGEVTIYPMFNHMSGQYQISFCPIGDAAAFTNPSYHLPAFYQLWAQYTGDDSWLMRATISRDVLAAATDRWTGLGPDFASYGGNNPIHWPDMDGKDRPYNHKDFNWDAWRITMNMAIDRSWFPMKRNEPFINRAFLIQQFFNIAKDRDGTITNKYDLNGNPIDQNNWEGEGLQATVATGVLAHWNFTSGSSYQRWLNIITPGLLRLWEMEPRADEYRYYDGCLYMLSTLMVSGNYRYEDWTYGND